MFTLNFIYMKDLILNTERPTKIWGTYQSILQYLSSLWVLIFRDHFPFLSFVWVGGGFTIVVYNTVKNGFQRATCPHLPTLPFSWQSCPGTVSGRSSLLKYINSHDSDSQMRISEKSSTTQRCLPTPPPW